MKYKVVYFSRTSTSKNVAVKIANKLSCEVIEITDGINWKGVLGFIKGGYYASTDKDVEIKINGNLDNTDEFIVVTPLWAGGTAPAVRSLLRTIQLDRVHLVVTSDGSTIKNPLGFKSVTNIVKKNNNEEEIINSLINKLL